MKTACLLVLGLLCGAGLSAQTVIMGRVVDGATNQPLPATIYLSSLGASASCDGNGWFSLALGELEMEDTLVVSELGYLPQWVAIADIGKPPLMIVLVPNPQQLQQVNISSRLADSLVHAAFDAIGHNYPQQPTVYPSFYRQVHQENGQYVRLIEAALDIKEPAYAHRPFWKDYTGINVAEMRRSEIFEQNGDQHGDHITDLLDDNPILYFAGTFLNPAARKDVLFWMDTLQHNGDSLVVIDYESHTVGEPRIENGKIFIHMPDMAILRVESTRRRNKAVALVASTSGHEWDLVQGGRIVQFAKRGGVYCLDSIEMWYTHDVREHDFPTKAWRVTEQFSLWAASPVGDTTQSFSQFGNLYGRHYTYHPDFWLGYAPYEQHPCNLTIITDLNNHRHTLKQQFEQEGEW